MAMYCHPVASISKPSIVHIASSKFRKFLPFFLVSMVIPHSSHIEADILGFGGNLNLVIGLEAMRRDMDLKRISIPLKGNCFKASIS